MARTPQTKEWIVSMLRGKRAERLGTVTAPDTEAAIAKAIDEFKITDPERQRRVIVRPIAQSDRSRGQHGEAIGALE